MLKIFEHMFVVFGEYNPNDEYIGCNTKQADEISKYFDSDLNLPVDYVKVLCVPNIFNMIIRSIAKSYSPLKIALVSVFI